MMLTVFIRRGKKKIIHLPYEALDKAREMLYTYKDKIDGYTINICDYEKEENMEKLDNGKLS